MQEPTDRKNLTQLEVIELLTLLKTHSEYVVGQRFGISQQGVSYYRKKYGAYTPEIIDRVIKQLSKEESDFEVKVDYEKQALCTPKHLFFKCHDCGFIAGENNIQGIIDHLQRCTTVPRKYLTEQAI